VGLVLNTDTHEPGDMIDQSMARLVAAGAGLNPDEVEAATVTNPQTLVDRAGLRWAGIQRA
jgi:histidinol phosphatase-like PHP family hydrolase